MGGYYAPRVAAFEHRVKAAVSISGAFKTQMSADRVGEWIQFTHWAKTPEAAAQKANFPTVGREPPCELVEFRVRNLCDVVLALKCYECTRQPAILV